MSIYLQCILLSGRGTVYVPIYLHNVLYFQGGGAVYVTTVNISVVFQGGGAGYVTTVNISVVFQGGGAVYVTTVNIWVVFQGGGAVLLVPPREDGRQSGSVHHGHLGARQAGHCRCLRPRGRGEIKLHSCIFIFRNTYCTNT